MKTPWYISGLHFECGQCGNCCCGPGEGFIWLTKPEVSLIADFLKTPVEKFRKKFLKRVGLRTSIIEEPIGKDCIFANEIDGQKKCEIYPFRPNQCRTWPFWSYHLKSPNTWNQAAKICPGINRGKLYSFEEIEKIKKQKKWWLDEK